MHQELDPHAFALSRIGSLQREFVWPFSDVEGLRRRLRGMIGAVDDAAVPLDGRTLTPGPSPSEGRGEAVTFCSRDGVRVFGYWIEPEAGSEAPVVICVPGHGTGVDALVGIAPEDYQHQFALQAVRAGFRVLAIEPCSFGHRKSAIEGERDSSCVRDMMAALMLGETLVGWRVRDAMAAVDYAKSRGAEKVAIMGISGGGLVAYWTAALDTRIDACVVSGYFNTFFDSILSIDHCPDNFVPGLSKVVEMPDMAALIAPRALFVESGTEDPIFPAEAFLGACRRAEEIYGGSDQFEYELFTGGHEIWGRRAFPFLQRVLG